MIALPLESGDPRLRLKAVARRLFAERGLRGVTVREIAQAAGQRNQGAVAYYFGTKERLVAEILIDGATRVETLRKIHLDRLEAEGGPRTVAEAVGAIILPSAAFGEEDSADGRYFDRFLAQVSLGSGDLIDRTLEGRWNQGYQRCLRHLRRLMPGLTPAEKNRRFLFLSSYLGSVMATRETMLSDTSRAHPTWRADATLDDIVTTAAAILEAPPPRPAHG